MYSAYSDTGGFGFTQFCFLVRHLAPNAHDYVLSTIYSKSFIFFFVYSYLLNVPFRRYNNGHNNDDGTGIVYAWIGSKSDPEDARLIGEVAEEMFNNVSYR